MPQIYNGCGTWYYGKKNIEEHLGTCRHCHREALLKSYDTRLYVVIVMVPVFPLGARRIIEQCPVCRRHGVVPLSDYRAAQERAKQTLAAYRASPADPELAKEALRGCVAYRNLSALLDVGPEIEENLSGDARSLRLLAGAYELFGRMKDVERLLQTALSLDPADDETREAMAECLMRLGKVEEAEPLLSHVVEKGLPDRLDALVNLAQGYQIKGEHDKALKIYEQCEKINPMVAQNPAFRRLRDLAIQNLGKHVPVNPAKVMQKERTAAKQKRAWKIAAVVVILAIIAYLAVALVEGLQRKVYLVNGVGKPYTARINGKDYAVPVDVATPVRMSEGDLTIEIPGSGLPVQTAAMHSGFFLRPFTRDAFVINPDGAAIIEKAKVYYSPVAAGGGGTPPTREYGGGQVVLHFDDIDCPFEDFPKEVSVESSSHEASRTGLKLMNRDARVTPPHLLVLLSEKLGEDATVRIAQRRAIMNPQEWEYLQIIQAKTEPKALVDFLKAGLAERPVRMDWHREYQDTRERLGEKEQVEAEYTAMLAAEPNNADLIYLTGRTARDPAKRLELYQRAAVANPPCNYAFYSLCTQAMSDGRFHDAATAAVKVREVMAGQTWAQAVCREAFIADGQFDEALAMVKGGEQGDLLTRIAALSDEIYIHAARKENAEVERILGDIRLQVGNMSAKYADDVIREQRAAVAYVQGDAATCADLLKDAPEASTRWEALLMKGDVSGAERVAKDFPKPSDETLLLMYIAGQRYHETSNSEEYLKRAVELLSKGDFDERIFAAALMGKPEVKVNDLLTARAQPSKKTILLTAVGLKNPAMRQQCFVLARVLNYDRRFPYLLIESTILTAGQ